MSNTNIEEAFARDGYQVIPFTFNGAGHPVIEARLENGTPLTILLDTGASANLLDLDFAESCGLNPSPTGEKGGGAGGLTLDVYRIETVSLYMGGRLFRFSDFLSMDFSTIHQSMTDSGLQAAFQGILGFGFFKQTRCFIDYASDRIFIQQDGGDG